MTDSRKDKYKHLYKEVQQREDEVKRCVMRMSAGYRQQHKKGGSGQRNENEKNDDKR